jgi:hypothetical protein
MAITMLGRRAMALCLCVTALWVAGCASEPRNAQTDATIKTVAVVSMLEEDIHLRKLGLTVFNNDTRPIGRDMGLNRLAVQTVEARLRKARPEWLIVASDADSKALATQVARPTFNAFYPEGVKAELAAIAKRTNADALFVVVPTTRENAPPGRGVGALVRALPGMDPRLDIQAYVLLVLVDAKGEQITNRSTGNEGLRTLTASALGLSGDLTSLESGETRSRLVEAIQRQLVTALNTASGYMGY